MSEIEKILDIILTHLDILDNSCRMIEIQVKCLKGAINRDKSMTEDEKINYITSINDFLPIENEINTASFRTVFKNIKHTLEIHASSS